MKKTLLHKLFLFTFICALGIYQTNAQADLVYTFDGATWEGWNEGGGGTGAWASLFGNNPNGELEITWPTTSNNAIMYAPTTVEALDTNYKYMQLKISNNSSQVDLLRIRARDAGGTWFNAKDIAITTHGSGVFETFDFEITNATWTGTLQKWQVIFRRSDNGDITDGGTVFVDNILVSQSSTLSTDNKNAFEFAVYPNPVKNVLHINTLEAIEKVEVFDLLGKSVLSQYNVMDQVDVSALNKSLYILKLTSDKGVSTKKFVKE
ncbi:T9SS type A sorting domain-containing protein [Seonamhaeicola maritimus]|uniref:T9SS type A sorting domain-containing protein n=1 Tax=Seonamhaeicola maritimus TaxID=2591822 RepID=A0A5C7GEV4_9FLAO|nr:T9SS type A sorting domain-containing protein [Seonamhaeicola maritimus]TXG35146.1 T9SS type A sorting domain-containing protein [Seonamhaeicola maritimus]